MSQNIRFCLAVVAAASAAAASAAAVVVYLRLVTDFVFLLLSTCSRENIIIKKLRWLFLCM